MILMPLHRQVQGLVVAFVEEIAAQIERQLPLHDARRTMETPFEQLQSDVTDCVNYNVMRDLILPPLNLVYKPTEQQRIQSIHEIRAQKHRVDGHVALALGSRIAPSRAQQRKIRVLQAVT